MIFHSLDFVAFFLVTVTLYWQLSHRWQNRLLLAASYVNLTLVQAPRGGAARGGHRRFEIAPLVGGYIIDLDNVGVARARDECRAYPATDHVNLAVYKTRCGMIARGRH